MVQIEPPPGWKRPAKSAPPTAPPAASGEAPASAATVESQRPAADDAPPLPPGMIVAPQEATARRVILIGGTAVALLIVGFGLWSTFGGRGEDSADEVTASAVPTASSSPTKPRPTTSTTGTLKKPAPSPSSLASVTPTPSPSPTSLPSPTVPVPAATSTPTAPPVLTASASPTGLVPTTTPTPGPPHPSAAASPTAVPSPPLPVPAPTVAPPVPQPPPAPAPQIDVAARLADQIPELAFEGTPLRRALLLVSRVSTVRVNYDADSVAAADVQLDEPVTLKLSGATVEEAFVKLAAAGGLQCRTIGDQVVVYAPSKETAVPATTTLAVEDLTGADEAATKQLADWVRRFTVPGAWDERWGGKLVIRPGQLEVTQTPEGQREVAGFLDRLRVARGKPTAGSPPSLETRYRQAREALERPVTMNFRPGAELEEITGRVEAAAGVTVLISHLELATQGFFGNELIGISADKHAAAQVLTALCEPRDWAWRIVGPKLLEITTRDALRRRPYVEFYPLPAAAAGDLVGADWVAKIRTQLADEPWRDAPGDDLQTAGDVLFDELSQRLIVRQHQGAHLRIERLLAEGTKSPPAVPAPKATASPTGAPGAPIAPARPSSTAAPSATGLQL